MRNSQLYKTWISLCKEDKMAVKKAVSSPFFNNRPEVILLEKYLEKYGDTLPVTQNRTDPLQKEVLFKNLFGEKMPYNDGKIRQLMSFLLEVIKNCLIWQQLQRQPEQKQQLLCLAWKHNKQDELMEREINSLHDMVEKSPLRNDAYFHQTYQLELEKWEMVRQRQRDGIRNLQLVFESFSAYVAINTLRQACTAQVQQSLAKHQLEIPFLQETLLQFEKGLWNSIPAADTWYCSYKALTDRENESYFQRLRSHIEKDGEEFSISDLRDLYILAINICIKRINSGDKNYIQEAFDLYKKGLERKTFLENGYLSRFTYRNILTLAVAIGEWDWSLDYLQKFKDNLPPKEREHTFNYNLATYYFRKKSFDQAMKLLREIDMKDILENFDCRRMLLRIYFEKNEWKALDSLLDSFDIFLSRNKGGGYHREMYQNMVRCLRKIIALPPNDQSSREKLRITIKEASYIAEREWLLHILSQK